MTSPDTTEALPRLLTDLRPAVGLTKADYSDFVVEEIPLYAASGTGTHTYFLVEKSGLSTMQAVNHIAQRLGVLRRVIGYAGLKDARAVTRQWMSVEHVEPEQVRTLDIPRLRILAVTRHTNKLHLGHLRANRFVIRVRQTEPERLAELQDALATLSRRGVPNYFGHQRFGSRGDSWQTGRAILRGQLDEAVDIVLGRPGDYDHGDIRRARILYERGEFAKAGQLWPGVFCDERRALRALAKTGGKKRRAFMAIDKHTRIFYMSAYQSHLFNRVVAAQLANGLDRLDVGDLAWVHASGAVFRVEDASVEQPRCERFEISPTGPLFGYRMTTADGSPGELERRVLDDEQLPANAFRTGPVRVKGVRRPLRFRPDEAALKLGADDRGIYLELTFALSRGCYATALLRELFQEGHPGTEPEADEDDTSSL